MERLCRLCLGTGSDLGLGPISEDNENVNTSSEQNLVQLILRYLSIQIIKAENPISSFICTSCKSLIENWHRFHTSCLENDEIYHQRVQALHQANKSNELVLSVELKEERLDTATTGDENPPTEEHLDPDYDPKESTSDEDDDACDDRDDDSDFDVASEYSTYEYEILESESDAKARSRKKKDNKADSKTVTSTCRRGRPRLKTVDDATSKVAKRAEVCTICGKFIKNLTEHMRIHNNERRHQCPYCAKSFVSASNYSSHVNIHTRAKMYKCDLCDKQYALLNSMKQHRITHFKDRIYLCPVCGKAYYQPTGLARHKRTHFEQPTIKCSECDKMFLTNGDLRKHFKKHLPEKPFSCEICSRAFNRKDNLKTHMKTHREKASKSVVVDKLPVQEAVPHVEIKLEISKV
nr:zinc finger protein 569-like [Aedes albopictus]